MLIEPRAHTIGGVTVGRLLPSIARRSVGPFIFFDRAGPAEFTPGNGLDVPPHPHIGLATVTYVLDGEILHRDSLGSKQLIRPGAINWMTAGRGIAHSERTPAEARPHGARVEALQFWIALPREDEELAPSFQHHPAHTLPAWEESGARVRLLAGSAFGAKAPVETRSPLFYLDATLPAGGSFPLPPEHPEHAAYLIEGLAWSGAERVEPGRLLVFQPGATLRAETASRVVLFGGAPLGPRHMWWNFVSSSKDRIEQAKSDWENGLFQKVADDEQEFVKLPARK